MKRLLILDKGQPLVGCGGDDVRGCIEKKSRFWLDIESPEDADFEILERDLKMPGPRIDEIQSGQSLPKLRTADGLSFLSWYAIDLKEVARPSRFECVLNDKFLVTVHPGRIELIDKIFKTMESDKAQAAKGPERVLYELVDAAVDEYFLLVDSFSDEIDDLEDKMFAEPTSKDVKRLFALKRHMLELRRVTAPEREVINSILRREETFVSAENIAYYDDLYDHLVRIIDLVDTLRDVASGAMQIYQATISNNLNSIMKTLTIIATIAMPLTVIAGIYGMNFRNMPELHWRFGYFYILGLMFAITAVMIYWFWHRKWL